MTEWNIKNSQRSRPPHDLRSESRQLRLMILLLGVVVILAFEAAQPRHWSWLTHSSASASPNVPPPEVGPPLPDPRKDREFQQTLQAIHDDTLLIRASEQDAYRGAWDYLKQHATQLQNGTLSTSPGYRDVAIQPAEFRGALFRLRGRLRRLTQFSNAFPGTDTSAPPVYEGWMFTADSGNHPWVFQCASLPSSLLPGDRLDLPIEVTGIFLKRMGYESHTGGVTAPLLIALEPRLIPQSTPTGSSLSKTLSAWLGGFLLFMGLAAIAGWRLGGVSRSRRQVHPDVLHPDHLDRSELNSSDDTPAGR